MGSTGAFPKTGGFTEQNWQEAGTFHGIKILIKKSSHEQPDLPFWSNTPGTGYLLLNKNGTFKQYRQYGENCKAIFDLDYGEHKH